MTTLYKIGGITAESDTITVDSGQVKLGTDNLVPVRLPNFANGDLTATATGLIAYNTTSNKVYFRNNTTWGELASSGGNFSFSSSQNLAGLSTYSFSGLTGKKYKMTLYNIVGSSATRRRVFIRFNGITTATYNYADAGGPNHGNSNTGQTILNISPYSSPTYEGINNGGVFSAQLQITQNGSGGSAGLVLLTGRSMWAENAAGAVFCYDLSGTSTDTDATDLSSISVNIEGGDTFTTGTAYLWSIS